MSACKALWWELNVGMVVQRTLCLAPENTSKQVTSTRNLNSPYTPLTCWFRDVQTEKIAPVFRSKYAQVIKVSVNSVEWIFLKRHFYECLIRLMENTCTVNCYTLVKVEEKMFKTRARKWMDQHTSRSIPLNSWYIDYTFYFRHNDT